MLHATVGPYLVLRVDARKGWVTFESTWSESSLRSVFDARRNWLVDSLTELFTVNSAY